MARRQGRTHVPHVHAEEVAEHAVVHPELALAGRLRAADIAGRARPGGPEGGDARGGGCCGGLELGVSGHCWGEHRDAEAR